MNWFQKKNTSKKWNINIGEALDKYGSATAILDEISEDLNFGEESSKRMAVWHPIVALMLMERYDQKKNILSGLEDGKKNISRKRKI